MGEVIHIHEHNSWSEKTDDELLHMFMFIAKCGQKVLPHRLHVEFYRRKVERQQAEMSRWVQNVEEPPPN